MEIQLNTMTGSTIFKANKRIDTYHAIFNPVGNLPKELKLDFKDNLRETTILSVKFEIK